MIIQYTITDASKYIDEETVVDIEGNPIISRWQMYSCAFDNENTQSWNGDIPLNEPVLTPTSELIQNLIDVYGVSLIGKTITIDLNDADGNIVRLT